MCGVGDLGKHMKRRVKPPGRAADIADSHDIERSPRESEERYGLVTEAVGEGIYDWNIELNTLFVSPRLRFSTSNEPALNPAPIGSREYIRMIWKAIVRRCVRVLNSGLSNSSANIASRRLTGTISGSRITGGPCATRRAEQSGSWVR